MSCINTLQYLPRKSDGPSLKDDKRNISRVIVNIGFADDIA